MTDTPTQNVHEKLNATAVFLLAVVLGWGPFVATAWRAPYTERAFLLVSVALGFISLMLVYDAAERFLSRGRGVYVAAIFCSLPATGLVITNPGLLPVTMLMLLVSAATWFAIRATGEQRNFVLAMLAGLLVISGYGYVFFPGALILLFPIWLATSHSSRRALLTILLVASYGLGLTLRALGVLPLPILQLPSSSNFVASAIVLMPWRAYAVPVFILLLFARRQGTSWHFAALISMVIALALAAAIHGNLMAVGAVIVPVLALLAGALSIESFQPELERSSRLLLSIPPVLTAAAIIAYSVLGLAELASVNAPGNVRLAVAAILVILLVMATWRWLPRMNFALLFVAALWFGSYLWPPDISPEERAVISAQAWFIIIPAAAFIGWILFRVYYGRGIPRAALRADHPRFGGEDLRTYHDTSAWEGQQIHVSAGDSYTFTVFGDVTGAESPVTARHGGYYAFRNLTERMKQDAPRFAISLGDLALAASSLSFRRVRKLLSLVPVPLTAIPGNHDIFRGSRDDIRYFQSLFGADNRSFRVGPVQFILMNNAVGAYDGASLAWLEEALQQASKAPFLLVFCHKPVFDPRPGGTYAMEWRDQAEHLHELFRRHEVTAVFSGHIHTLASENRDGVTYIISGGGGSRLTSAEDVHHYLRVEVSTSALAVSALSVEAAPRTAKPQTLLELHFSLRTCCSAVHATS